MGDTHQYDPYSQGGGGGGGAETLPRRPGMRRSSGAAGGEIVEVQGGHIVRSTGRKDRHSKVCTAKGPRDRRVRLSAHTAIEFYDVQDRLGYDRPSKAVDWLINKAKSAIDDLAELPAWKPTATSLKKTRTAAAPVPNPPPSQHLQEDSFTFDHQLNRSGQGSGFLPPSLDSDAIADTIKSFFPMGSAETAPYPVPDLLSRTSSSGGGHTQQDLRLSLHSQEQHPIHMFPGPAAHFPGFDGPSSSSGGGWPEHHQQFQRMVAAASWSSDSPGGFIPQAPILFGQNQQLVMSQRGPLQSSNSHSVRAWVDPAAADQFHPGMGFSAGGSFGFRIPARIQGDQEEQHDGIHNKPSSTTSSESRH